ncbi:MAG: DUF11 domain-containing protein [bacterium]
MAISKKQNGQNLKKKGGDKKMQNAKSKMQKGLLLAMLTLGLMMVLAPKTVNAQVGTSGTTANTQILNMATATYVIGGNTRTTTTNISITVGQIYGGSWTVPANKDGIPNGTVEYVYELMNKGNYADTFNLTLDTTSLPSGWTAEIRVNGVATTTITLAEDAVGTFAVRVSIPATATNGEKGTVSITTTTTDDGGTYTVGNWIYGGLDLLSDTRTTTVMAAVISLSKIIYSYGTPTGYGGSNSYVPGGTITYMITYRNDGAATATDVTITDIIPAHTTYATETMRIGTSGDTYESADIGYPSEVDDNDGSESPPCANWNITTTGAVTFKLGDVGPNAEGRLFFRVYIK